MVTVIAKVALCPGARVVVQVAMPPENPAVQLVPATELSLTPAGRVSETFTLVEADEEAEFVATTS
jgi:hypothetical protein